MERYMVTHSLLSSWLYAMRDNPYADAETEPEDPLAEFKQVLNRVPMEQTDAMRRGIQFEDLVTSITHGQGDPKEMWYPAASQIAEIVGGGQLQVKRCETVPMEGMNIFLYGRLDALKAGSIYDIKYCERYDKGKYFDSTQHPMYLELVPAAREFTYLISNGQYVWKETYRRDETKSILPIVHDFLDWLTATGMMATFKEKWLAL